MHYILHVNNNIIIVTYIFQVSSFFSESFSTNILGRGFLFSIRPCFSTVIWLIPSFQSVLRYCPHLGIAIFLQCAIFTITCWPQQRRNVGKELNAQHQEQYC